MGDGAVSTVPEPALLSCCWLLVGVVSQRDAVRQPPSVEGSWLQCSVGMWGLEELMGTMTNGESFCNPNPHIQGKNLNKNMAAKLSSLPCFEAFGAIFCRIFVHIFTLYVGGGGHSRVSETKGKTTICLGTEALKRTEN